MNVGHFFSASTSFKNSVEKNSAKSMWVKNSIFMSERQYEKICEINVRQKFNFYVRSDSLYKNSAKSM